MKTNHFLVIHHQIDESMAKKICKIFMLHQKCDKVSNALSFGFNVSNKNVGEDFFFLQIKNRFRNGDVGVCVCGHIMTEHFGLNRFWHDFVTERGFFGEYLEAYLQK